MNMPSTITAAMAAAFLLLVALPVVALADRLFWLHTGAPVLGSINLDNVPELQGLCPQAAWVEVKASRTDGSFAYRCKDATWFRPFATCGRSPELQRLWRERTGEPPKA